MPFPLFKEARKLETKSTSKVSINTLLDDLRKPTAQVDHVKSDILRLVSARRDKIYTPNHGKTVLHALMQYYEEFNEKDDFNQFIRNITPEEKFIAICHQILLKRWPQGRPCYARIETDAKPFVQIMYDCDSFYEAFLVAHAFDTILEENYKFFPRAAVNSKEAIRFASLYDNKIRVTCQFYPQEYKPGDKPLELRKTLSVSEKSLSTCLTNHKLNYTHYCEAKGWPTTRGLPPPGAPGLNIARQVSDAPVEARNIPCKILVITDIIAGSGNLFFARKIIGELTQHFPQTEFHWILADSGSEQSFPGLSDQTHVHRSDALWKLTPLIEALSSGAFVLHLPNHYVSQYEHRLKTKFIHSPFPSIIVNEYNTPNSTIVENRVQFGSGINNGLGIVKPIPLNFPNSLEDKRAALCKIPELAPVFQKAREVPVFFGYVAHFNTFTLLWNLRHFEILAIFALFAKEKKLNHFKVILPISYSNILNAIKLYPRAFNDCSFYYKSHSREIEWGKGEIQIEIFNLFPFENSTFRALMDYGAACETPVVATGDQSFTELFFSIQTPFVFIYQILNLKRPLYHALRDLVEKENLTTLFTHLRKSSQFECTEEHQLISLANFLVENWVALKEETAKLTKIMQEQPNLSENLAEKIKHVMLANQKREEMPHATVVGVKEEKAEAAAAEEERTSGYHP